MALETLFNHGDHFFDGLIKECKKARQEILIEAYIFETDDLGRRLLKVLKRKAKEGVKVRILLDGIGSFSFCPLLFKKLIHENFEIRFFNPLPFQIISLENVSIKTRLSSLMKGLFFINKRNHRKTYIIDKRIAYVGSINITRLHSYRLSGERSWRDTGIKLKDERVPLLRETFHHTWNNHLTHMNKRESFPKAIKSIRSGLRLNDGVFSRSLQNNDLISRIQKAEKRIWITNPYFVPTSRLLNALKEAAQRGVNVSIIIPRKSDMKLFPLINSLSCRKLALWQINIFEYLPRILHAKTVIIDDWFMLGSSNMNNRSIKHDYEVDVVLRSTESKQSLTKQFLFDLADSTELKRNDILKRYGTSYFASLFFGLIRYWL